MDLRAIKIKRDYLRDAGGTNIFTAVHETDFELRGGEFIEIVGRSGSGKSTFVNMLAGLLTPSSGTVLVDEADIYDMSDIERSHLRNRSIGMIPQVQTGIHSLTVAENIMAPAMMYGNERSIEDIEKRASELMEMLDIKGLSNVYSNELSGGELRRLAIARALINDPDMIIADEPTGDLDDETSGLVLGLLKDRAEEGKGVLIVTHEKEAASYADAIYKMEKGVLKNTV